jgi:hypothetical protein
VIAVFAMIRFCVGVCSRAHILKTRFRQRALVLGQCALSRSAGTEKECPDRGERKQ